MVYLILKEDLIERDLPNTLKIRIEERQPVARLTNKNWKDFTIALIVMELFLLL